MKRKLGQNMDEALDTAIKKDGLPTLKETSFKVVEEKLTAGMTIKLKPSEKDRFYEILGRKSASAEVRKMILNFISEHERT